MCFLIVVIYPDQPCIVESCYHRIQNTKKKCRCWKPTERVQALAHGQKKQELEEQKQPQQQQWQKQNLPTRASFLFSQQMRVVVAAVNVPNEPKSKNSKNNNNNNNNNKNNNNNNVNNNSIFISNFSKHNNHTNINVNTNINTTSISSNVNINNKEHRNVIGGAADYLAPELTVEPVSHFSELSSISNHFFGEFSHYEKNGMRENVNMNPRDFFAGFESVKFNNNNNNNCNNGYSSDWTTESNGSRRSASTATNISLFSTPSTPSTHSTHSTPHFGYSSTNNDISSLLNLLKNPPNIEASPTFSEPIHFNINNGGANGTKSTNTTTNTAKISSTKIGCTTTKNNNKNVICCNCGESIERKKCAIDKHRKHCTNYRILKNGGGSKVSFFEDFNRNSNEETGKANEEATVNNPCMFCVCVSNQTPKNVAILRIFWNLLWKFLLVSCVFYFFFCYF